MTDKRLEKTEYCGAKTRVGGTCKQKPMSNGRCHWHGGKSLKGLASPTLTRGGIYSKYLPTRLSTEYTELLTLGADLFKISDETAAVTTLIQEQLAKIGTGESGAAWGKLKELYDEAIDLSKRKELTTEQRQALFNALFTEMGKVINYGSMTYAARNEAVNLVEQKRKLVADERKDWAAKHQAMTFDRVLLILTAMATCFKESLEKHIDDTKSRRSVLTDTQDFLSRVISE